MNLKTIAKRTAAVMAFMGVMLSSTLAYGATSDPFNPDFSGKFTHTSQVYMTVSSKDAVMTKVIYPLTGSANRFLTIDNAYALICDHAHFYAKYNHEGSITYLDGTFVQYTSSPVIIETYDVVVDKFAGIFVTGVTINYNGNDYIRE